MFEKSSTLSSERRPLLRELPAAERRLQIRALLALGFLVSISLLGKFRYGQFELPMVHHGRRELGSWSWADVTPSRDLVWQSCYNGSLECARLDVPMDWQDPSDANRVVLGVIKLAARTKDESLPPVFINPGGPGGSGIDYLMNNGRELQTIDLVSFDPRGVGVSTPRVDCWSTAQMRHDWELQNTAVIDERPGLAYDLYARSIALSRSCEITLNSTGILRHVSTVYSARDMLEILNKTGHSKLRYWGFSYGTLLGGVFAALFPERVERLVSDGNVNYKGWYNVDIALSIADADLILDAFDRSCHEAGPRKCAFWASSPTKVQQQRAALLESLKKKPVIIPPGARESGPKMPELVTYSKVQIMSRGMLYKPLELFDQMAEIYAALEKGDGLPYYDFAHQGGDDEGASGSCEVNKIPTNMPRESSAEPDVFGAVMCSDARPLNDTAEEFAEYAETISHVSRWTGAASAVFRATCLGRTVRPKWKFSEEDIHGNTHFPILYVGLIADCATPLHNAYYNSARFPGSVVLVQNSYGHCSSAAPSTCTAKHIHTYFQNGTLPEPGTACDPDINLFGLPGDDSIEQHEELSYAVRQLSRNTNFRHIHKL
ncbi:Serine protease Hip1-like protein [Cladobotryum mycophilum]|uniref:Serine protease Hip1-like protein n=1 Tax=Cladobotryum mycophilum TaxID=491253 RepID=A0ABR0SCX4_9HYPO